MNKTKMHHRRNTLESIKELKKLPSINSLSINKAEDEEDYMPPAKEEAKVRGALENLQQDKPSTKGIFSRIYSIPSQDKMESSKRAMKSGQVPNTVNVYGSHYPVVRLLGDDTVLVHTSQYGNDGKTEELLSKIATHLPDIFPNHKIIEINHPDYTHSAKIMRIGNPKHIADYLQRAAQNHPDENYRLHAQDAHEHLTKMKKGQFTKPIHEKRMAEEGWDADKNMQIRIDRLHRYLTSIGLSPDIAAEGGRNLASASPTSITINKEGDPHDQQVVHEAAHAMLTPPKTSVKEYQQFIGKPGLQGKLRASSFRNEMKEMHGGGMPEQTTHHMEAGIRRRAGIEPFRSPERGVKESSAEEQSRKFAKEKLKNFDEGLESFDPFTGENTIGSSANALINAKVRVKKDPSARNKGMFENVKNAFKQRKEAEKKITSYDDMDLAASEKDVSKSSLEHPRDYYKRQKEQKQKEAAAEKKRIESGAKKPLDAAMEKLKIQNPPEIKKGENGDWKKEGHTLHHEAWNDDRPNFHPKTHDFKVTAKDKDGKVVGSASFTHENKNITPVLSLVNKEHRRKGIASGMYEHAQNLSGKKVKPSDQQSLDARKLWEAKDRKFGKSENDLAKDKLAASEKTKSNLTKNYNVGMSLNEETAPLMNRFEDKFFLPSSKFQEFVNAISKKLKEGDSDTSVRFNTNRTIYLDNRDLDSFRDNLEDIKPRFKVRIRQYKPNNDKWENTAYIELKIKTEDGFTKKTRIRIYAYMIDSICKGQEIKSDKMIELINKDITKMELWQRITAINTIIQKYGMRKQTIVEYHRRAYSGKNVRITIDDSLKYYSFNPIDENTGNAILNSDKWKKIYKPVKQITNNDILILEIKHEGKIPEWIQNSLKKLDIEPAKFSKYCASIATFLKNGHKDKGVIQRQKMSFDSNKLLNILKSEESDLTKGSLQRKMGNPKEQLKPNEGGSMIAWAEGSDVGSREDIPEASSKAKQRFFQKLHAQTQVKRHPKTGERMFLMHRGVAYNPMNRISHEFNKTSWTPKYDEALGFASADYDDEGSKDRVYSAWIPESAIHNYINNAITDEDEANDMPIHEQEYIVKPHDFIYAEKAPLSTSQRINARIGQRNKIDKLYPEKGGDQDIEGVTTKQDMYRELNKKPEKVKLVKSEGLPYDNWTHNSDQDIENEYNWEYKNHWDHTHLFPTLDHFKNAVKNAKVVEVTPQMNQKIGNRSNTSSIDELKDMTSRYQFPRDVDRIVHGFHNNHPIPHPIVIKHKGRYNVMSGNTRMDAAFLNGINPKVALLDLDQKEEDVNKSEKINNNLAKGSFQRRNPTRKKDISQEDLNNTAQWINATSGYSHNPSQEYKEKRNLIGKMPDKFLNRLKQKIGSLTHIKKHPETGELHALLHRAMSQREFDKYHKDGILNHHDTQTSWTTNRGLAEAFADDYDRSVEDNPSKKIVASAWVPLSSIVSAPFIIPKVTDSKHTDIFQKAPRNEHEIIIGSNHNSMVTNKIPKTPKDTLGERSKSYKENKWNHNMISRQNKDNDLAANENSEVDLTKGSLQRRNPFNPMSKESQEIRQKQREWTHKVPWDHTGKGRETLPKTKDAARLRALNKLAKQTQVRKHPETGERLFLMHRGMGRKEFDRNNKDGKAAYEKGTRTSWTSDHGTGVFFGSKIPTMPVGEHEATVSAWIPESSLIHSPNQFNSPDPNNENKRSRFESIEQEWIVEHNQPFFHAHSDLINQNIADDEIKFVTPDHPLKNPEAISKIRQEKLKDQIKYRQNLSPEEKRIAVQKQITERPQTFNMPKKDMANIKTQKLAASENTELDLTKGSLQRRNPFNPMSKEVQEIKDKQRKWTHEENRDSRIDLPRIEDAARLRALNKLAKQTHVRRHPETGERMFLMHRGMGHEEFHGANKDGKTTHKKGARTSWTPRYDVAEEFATTAEGDKIFNAPKGAKVENIISAWIPESSLIHSPNQFNAPSKENLEADKKFNQLLIENNKEPLKTGRSPTEKTEKEWIVEHGSEGFHHANLDALAEQNKQDNKINSRAGKSGDKASYRAKSLKQLAKPDTYQGQYGWIGEQKLAASEKIQTEALCPEALDNDLQKPFKSKAQRAFLYAHPEKIGGKKALKEWESKTPKNIPRKVKKKKK
jgi:hypothetical protein